MDKETAKQIAVFKGRYLYLDGLETLNKDTAEELAIFKGRELSLNGLETLDKETAKSLAKYKGIISASQDIKIQINQHKK